MDVLDFDTLIVGFFYLYPSTSFFFILPSLALLNDLHMSAQH